MKNRTDFIAGIVLAIFSILYYMQACSVRIFPGMGKSIVNSQTMPKIWAICLFLLAVCLISRPFRKSYKDDCSSGKKSLSLIATLKDNSLIIYTFGALFLYAIALEYVGFIISSAIYIFLQTLILMPKNNRSFIKAAILGVVSGIAAFCIFVYWLDVLLPVGKLFE
ncbi:MAG: tripartite tricarboxylate transporter TctB family protein [Succinatimonas sp.]|nr:tripartite tricarboxylate transporter TctB family protein [Succinatimonas sp.]